MLPEVNGTVHLTGSSLSLVLSVYLFAGTCHADAAGNGLGPEACGDDPRTRPVYRETRAARRPSLAQASRDATPCGSLPAAGGSGCKRALANIRAGRLQLVPCAATSCQVLVQEVPVLGKGRSPVGCQAQSSAAAGAGQPAANHVCVFRFWGFGTGTVNDSVAEEL